MVLPWARCFGSGELGLKEVVCSTEYRAEDCFGSTLGTVQRFERVGWGVFWASCRQDTGVTWSERLLAPYAGCCSRESSTDEQLGDIRVDLTVH